MLIIYPHTKINSDVLIHKTQHNPKSIEFVVLKSIIDSHLGLQISLLSYRYWGFLEGEYVALQSAQT